MRLLSAALFFLSSSAAFAAELPKAAVLKPTTSATTQVGIGGAVERVLRAQIDSLHVVSTAVSPALSLAELQLAVGCVGETRACLKAVAAQLEVDDLVLTNVDETGKEMVLSIALFEAQKNTDLKRVVRRASGAQAETELLDSIDGALRELFGLPPAPKRELSALPKTEVKKAVEHERPFPVLPVVVMGVGAAVVGAGAILGAASKSKEDDYAKAPIGNEAEVDSAIALRESGEHQATAANVLFAIGGTAIAAGVVLFFLHTDDESTVAMAPFGNPDGTMGVLIGGTFGGGR